jgi:hypothetical protein
MTKKRKAVSGLCVVFVSVLDAGFSIAATIGLPTADVEGSRQTD